MKNWETDYDKIRLELLNEMKPKQMLLELLAGIHGDGGHHTENVGLAQSVLDAEKKLEKI